MSDIDRDTLIRMAACRRQTLGGRCANPVTHSSTESDATNTAPPK